MKSKKGNIEAFATSAIINHTRREHVAGRKCWELGQPHAPAPPSLPPPSLLPPSPLPFPLPVAPIIPSCH